MANSAFKVGAFEAFNRTILELKWGATIPRKTREAFNRTILELKFAATLLNGVQHVF